MYLSTGLEGNILLWIQENLRTDWLNPILIAITSLGNAGLFWIVLTIALLILKRTRRVGILCVMALLGSVLINNLILKNVIARIRPYEVIEGLKIIVKAPMDTSFPSGHSAASFAAGVVLLRNLPKKAGIPLFVLAWLIALSRLYVGVHYPTDVAAGILSGTMIAIVVQWLYEKWEAKKLQKKEKEENQNQTGQTES